MSTSTIRRDWILVIDDDAPIRNIITAALESANTEVVPAVSAANALDVIRERAEEPLLVLIDVMMPGLDGLSLAKKLSTALRRSKLVVMSGHLNDISWWPVELRDITFLAKPFRVADLEALVVAARIEFKST